MMTRPSESIYVQLVEHGLDAAFLTRPADGAILYANPAACRLFGYTLDEFRALGRSAVVDLSDPRIRAALAQRLETGRFQGILPLRRKDGSRFSAALSSAVYTDSSGEQRTSMFVWDLTEQAQREEALRVLNAELSRALAEAPAVAGHAADLCLLQAYPHSGARLAASGGVHRRARPRAVYPQHLPNVLRAPGPPSTAAAQRGDHLTEPLWHVIAERQARRRRSPTPARASCCRHRTSV
jgi:PAS domain S-box-containing protein